MKTLRAIGSGALLWILIFFEVSILMFGFKLSSGPLYYLIHYVMMLVFTVICANIYFKKGQVGLKQGILAGLVMLITGIVLDIAITVPLFVKSWYYFMHPELLLGYFSGFLMIILISLRKK